MRTYHLPQRESHCGWIVGSLTTEQVDSSCVHVICSGAVVRAASETKKIRRDLCNNLTFLKEKCTYEKKK